MKPSKKEILSTSIGFTDCLKATELLESLKNRTEHEKIRLDGIALTELKNKPVQQILAWAAKQPVATDGHLNNIKDILHYMAWIIIVTMFFSGYGISNALLEYGGDKLVNILGYFMLLIFIPFLFSLYTIAYILLHSHTHDRNTHSVLKLMLKLLDSTPFGNKQKLQKLLSHQTLLKSLSLNYLQYGSIALCAGILSSLIITIATQDIAFGWNTTLSVTPELLSSITDTVALPWHTLIPSAVPSLELIETSHHFRLGNQIDPALIAQAEILGSWWQFLALSIIVWGLLPRLLLLYMARRDLHLAIEKTLLLHPNSQLLLDQMNELHITTHAHKNENGENLKPTNLLQPSHHADLQAPVLIGWNIDHAQLVLIMETMRINADHIYHAGGKNSLKDDDRIISMINTPVIVAVKAWEPPMREFLDFIRDLHGHSAKKITVFPIGTPEKGFAPKGSDVNIWSDKTASLQQPHIGIYRDSL